MAYELPILILPGQVAGSDFSTGNGYGSTGQFLITKISGNDTHVPCTAVTDRPSGIAQGNPTTGAALGVMAIGVSKVFVGSGGLTAGDEYGTDTQGKAVRKAASNTGANFGQFVLGTVLVGAAAGELATVTVGAPYRAQ
ncbi:hypothetical protein [Paraburkholderia fungorum]|uniref:hypothetical protein n=1 Tax=Paraburkholderia fungorum TaxID=134537 RepID=UPI003D6A95A9